MKFGLMIFTLVIISCTIEMNDARISSISKRLQSLQKLKVSKLPSVPEPLFKRSRISLLKKSNVSPAPVIVRHKRQTFFHRPGTPVPTSLEVVATAVRAKVVHGVKGNKEFPSRATPVAIRSRQSSLNVVPNPDTPAPVTNNLQQSSVQSPKAPVSQDSSIRGFKFNDDGTDKIIFIDLSELRASGFKFEDISELSFTGLPDVTTYDDVTINNLDEAERTLNQQLPPTEHDESPVQQHFGFNPVVTQQDRVPDDGNAEPNVHHIDLASVALPSTTTPSPTVTLHHRNQFHFNNIASGSGGTDNSLETLEAIKQAKKRLF